MTTNSRSDSLFRQKGLWAIRQELYARALAAIWTKRGGRRRVPFWAYFFDRQTHLRFEEHAGWEQASIGSSRLTCSLLNQLRYAWRFWRGTRSRKA